MRRTCAFVFAVGSACVGPTFASVGSSEGECVGLSPCAARAEATFVFVADVIAGPVEQPSAPPFVPGHSQLGPQEVRFRIVERFKGVAAGRREIKARIVATSAETVS
jgi:hypothetical protein